MPKLSIDALTRPEAFPHPADSVERIETHVSWVLLAGDFAYKIKKPLDLGFLDFSTLAQRRFYCEEEIRLNRRTAPDLYLDVVPIIGSATAPRIGGDGSPIEYAVRMRRFDSRMGFDRLQRRGELEPGHIVDLAGRLAALHATAEVADQDSRYARFDQVADPMRDNFDALAAESDPDRARRVRKLRDWTGARLGEHRDRIETRLRGGFVRECHGDAHLGNVTLVAGRATLFDCIEFSPDLRWIDVASDLAFTLMDLRDRGASELAWLLLDEYLARTGDFGSLPLLPLYVVYRAMVRAKVQRLARDQATDPARRRALDEEVAGYLRLACQVADEHRPGMFITTGLSGSGKSWLAERLVPSVGMVRVRSDVERKRLRGLTAEQRSGSGLDADLYSAESSERTYRRLAQAAEAACDAGIPVLLDAAFLQKARRDRFRRLAADRDVAFAILRCKAPEETLAARVQRRAQRGDDASEAGLEVLSHQQQTAEALGPDELACAIEVDTRDADAVETTAMRIAGVLAPSTDPEFVD